MKLTAAILSDIQDTVNFLANSVNYLTKPNEKEEREQLQYRLECIADSFTDYVVPSKLTNRVEAIKSFCLSIAKK